MFNIITTYSREFLLYYKSQICNLIKPSYFNQYVDNATNLKQINALIISFRGNFRNSLLIIIKSNFRKKTLML